MIILSDNKLNSNPHWSIPLDRKEAPVARELELFDTNGYDLTLLEQSYAELNHPASKHRYKLTLNYPWFTSEPILEGAHINHALLFERKGYTGPALEQLQRWSKENPLVHKLIQKLPYPMTYTQLKTQKLFLLKLPHLIANY